MVCPGYKTCEVNIKASITESIKGAIKIKEMKPTLNNGLKALKELQMF